MMTQTTTPEPPMSSENTPTDSGESPPARYGISSGILLSAVLSLIFIAILIFLLHLYARYLISRDRHRRTALILFRRGDGGADGGRFDIFEEHSGSYYAGLEPSVIASLPTFSYKKGIGFGQAMAADENCSDGREAVASAAHGHQGQECSVCLSELEEKEMVRLLPNCKHVFHVLCIDKWLRSNSTCPLCRTGVVPVKAWSVPMDVGAFLAPLPPEPPNGGLDGSSAMGHESATYSAATAPLGSSIRRMMNERRVQLGEDEE